MLAYFAHALTVALGRSKKRDMLCHCANFDQGGDFAWGFILDGYAWAVT